MTQPHLELGQVEQVFAQGQARDQDPSMAYALGRAHREVLLTLGQIANGQRPSTVLGGVIGPKNFGTPAIGDGNGRSLPEIAATAHFDLVNYNGIHTAEEVLEDLVFAGFLRYDEPKNDTPEALLREDEGGYYGPTYVLAEPIKLEIERLDPEADSIREAEIRAKTDRFVSKPPGIIQQWKRKRWVKKRLK